MSVGARIFVALVFGVLGISFVATTAALYYEFGNTGWTTFAIFYSHLFIFFPTFGIIALIAFYIPACVFVDMYWHHVPWGRVRFCLGTAVLIGITWLISVQLQQGKVPDLWGIKPSVLKADRGGAIAGCDETRQSCKYASVLDAVSDLRAKSQTRLGLSKFARECNPDTLVEKSAELLEKRYCFVTATLLNAEDCCRAQKSFSQALVRKYEAVKNRSMTQAVHYAVLPLKVFFLLVILLIGVFLALWRRSVDRHYQNFVFYMERGLLVGALAMLFWPISNHAFLQSREVLYGAFADGIYATIAPVMSIVFGGWALALLFFFFRGMEKDVEAVGKISGVIGSAIAILKYDAIIDYSVRIAGSGADQVTFGVLTLLAILFFVPMFLGKKKEIEEKDS